MNSQQTCGDGEALALSPYRGQTRIEQGRVLCEPRRRKVAIVAFSQTAASVHYVRDDPEWEVWGLNNGYEMWLYYDSEGRLRTERWFELHPIAVQPRNDWTWLHTCPVPIYVLDTADPHPLGYSPQAVTFPRAACEAMVHLPAPFWACTFSYQIALAILEGFEEIALFGLDCGTSREWIFERPNVLFWIGYALGKGIRITCPVESTLFRHPYAYGYDYQPEVDWCQQGVDYLMACWGYEMTPRATAREAERARRIQEAIVR